MGYIYVFVRDTDMPRAEAYFEDATHLETTSSIQVNTHACDASF